MLTLETAVFMSTLNISAGMLFFFAVVRIAKDQFWSTKIFGALLFATDFYYKKITCTTFSSLDHSLANYLIYLAVIFLCIPPYILIELTRFFSYLDKKFSRTETSFPVNLAQEEERALKEKWARKCTERKFLFGWISFLAVVFSLYVKLKVLTSCKDIGVTLMSHDGGIKNDIGECVHAKTTVCWHELTQNWDYYVYNDPGTCNHPRFDNMDSSIVKKK
jgi:hypothetical protein